MANRIKSLLEEKQLTEPELQEILDHLDEISEDGVDYDDDSDDGDSIEDPTYNPDNDQDVDNDLRDVSFELDAPEEDNNENIPRNSNTQNILNNEKQTKAKKNVKPKIIWKNYKFQLNEEQVKFTGNEKLSHEIMELTTPYSFFKYFMTEDYIKEIHYQTNLYSTQKQISKPVNVTPTEIKQYMGICVMMSVIHLPNLRSYWSTTIGVPIIKECMSVNRFEKIREHLHFNDNMLHIPKDQEGHDRLHKIRPLLTHLQKRFASVTLEPCLSVDEQMCATKARHFLKQYMPLKPHKWGFKLFILYGVSGFTYAFEIYSGQENIVNNDECDLGASSNVVVRLCRNLERGKNYRVYFDNYYTSLSLISYLAKQGIHSLGTIKRNRIPECKLPSEKEMKKQKRGYSYENVGNVDDVDISVLAWKDNKIVTLASSFVGQNPISEISRYDKNERKTIAIDCPDVVKQYNKHMGGVDLLDSFIGRYHIQIRSKKWYLRIFYHLLDLTVINAWLLYKRVNAVKQANGEAIEKVLPLWEFRAEVAQCLCKEGTFVKKQRGRPSTSLDDDIKEKRKKASTSAIPPQDIRKDKMDHFPNLKLSGRDASCQNVPN